MSVDQRLREILARDADSFRPDVEQSLQMVMRGARRSHRLRWFVAVTVALIIISAVIAWPRIDGRDMVADPAGNPPTGRWMALPAGPLSARHEAVGAWIGQRFVIMGGWDTVICGDNGSCAGPLSATSPQAFRDGAAFDPVDETWTPIAEAPVPISRGSTAVIGDELFLLTPVSGGPDDPDQFVSYDAENDRWAELPPPPHSGLTLVAAGRYVVALSMSDELGAASDLVFDPDDRTWRELPDDPLGPSFDRMAVWTGTTLLLASKELVGSPGAWEPANPAVIRLAELDGSKQQQRWPDGLNFESWTRRPDSEIVGYIPSAVGTRIVWPDLGSADGGGHWNRSYDFGGIYDPANLSWQPLPKPPRGPGLNLDLDYECCPLTVDDRVVVDGHLLDPVSRTWLTTAPFPDPTRQAATILAGPHMILVWGGGTPAANVATGYLLRL